MTQNEIQKAIYRLFERGIENPKREGGYAGVVEVTRAARLCGCMSGR